MDQLFMDLHYRSCSGVGELDGLYRASENRYDPPPNWGYLMRSRLALLIVALSLPASGCAQCALESLLMLMPNAYSGVGGGYAAKSADLDQRIEESQQLRDREK